MHTRLRLTLTLLAVACLIALAGCATVPPPPRSAPEAPTGTSSDSSDLLSEITAASYTQWAPAPGYATRQPAKGPHGDEVQIFLDPAAEKALAEGSAEWPEGAVVAKDIYSGGQLIQVAAMKKTADGWFWGEWDAQGTPIVVGLREEPCESCHAKGTDGTLGVTLK